MYAIISSGGKQYRVSSGDVLQLEKLDGDVGDQVVFDDVLFVGDSPSSEASSLRVTGRITKKDRHKKILVFKFKRRKMYRRTAGHRQQFTEVTIDQIGTGKSTKKASAPTQKEKADKVPAAKQAAEAPKKAAEAPKKVAEAPKKGAEPPKKVAEIPKKAAGAAKKAAGVPKKAGAAPASKTAAPKKKATRPTAKKGGAKESKPKSQAQPKASAGTAKKPAPKRKPAAKKKADETPEE